MSGFYIILPSNSTSFPENKPSKFRVNLPQSLNFNSEWYCGVHSIIYPHTWTVLGSSKPETITVEFKNGTNETYYIDAMSPYNAQKLEENLNNYLKSQPLTLKQDETNNRKRRSIATDKLRENKRKKAEQEAAKKTEEEQKAEAEKKQEEEADQKTAEEEKAKKEAEQKAAEEKKKKEEADKKAEETRKNKEEADKIALEEQKKKQASDKKALEDKQKKDGEDKKTLEEKQKKEAVDKKAVEEKQKKDAVGKKAADEKQKKDAEAKKAAEEKQKKDAEGKKAADEKQKKDAEAKKAVEEKQKKDAEAKKAADEKLKKEAEAKKAADEKLKKEAEVKKAADEKLKKEAEVKKAAEEKQKKEAAEKKEFEEKQQEEAERQRKIQEEEKAFREADENRLKTETEKLAEEKRILEKTIKLPRPLPLVEEALIDAQMSEEDLIDSSIIRNWKNMTQAEKESVNTAAKDLVEFVWNPRNNRFNLFINNPDIERVILSEELAWVLGFKETNISHKNNEAIFEPDLNGAINNMLIYSSSNLCENMVLGDVMSNLLRIVNIESTPGSMVEKTYQHPIYNKVASRHIKDIEIEIKTMANELINFTYGSIILTLHFIKNLPY